MGVPKRILGADLRPLARPCRHPVVEARRGFHDDERPVLGLEREIGAVQPERALTAGTYRHLDAFLTQEFEPAATDAWIGIDGRRHDARDAGCRDALHARAGPADVRARLERAVQRRAPCEIAGLVERAHLGVGPPARS